MTDELKKLEALFAASTAATKVVRESRAAMLTSLEAEAHPLPEHTHGLANPQDALRRAQDVKIMADRIVAALTSIEWPTSAHHQRYVDLRNGARTLRPVRAKS